MKDYDLMSQDEKDDVIVGFMRAQEQDLYCLRVNLDRYTIMLTADFKDAEWRRQIAELLAQTTTRMIQVESIVQATTQQMPSKERVDASMQRLRAREAQQQPR